MHNKAKLYFFLGGRDLEMETIAKLIERCREELPGRIAGMCDKQLSWGAKASDYQAEIWRVFERGDIPVLVELYPDTNLPEEIIIIDHHNENAGKPSALRQVFDLLGLPDTCWTRELQLISENDTGHIRRLRNTGATESEIIRIRKADRRAQGITGEEEETGRSARLAAETCLGGSLVVVDLPHDRTATVTDPMALSGDYRDLLVFCPNGTHFFGNGARVAALGAKFPGGWSGGELPVSGFWGIGHRLDRDAVISALA